MTAVIITITDHLMSQLMAKDKPLEESILQAIELKNMLVPLSLLLN